MTTTFKSEEKKQSCVVCRRHSTLAFYKWSYLQVSVSYQHLFGRSDFMSHSQTPVAYRNLSQAIDPEGGRSTDRRPKLHLEIQIRNIQKARTLPFSNLRPARRPHRASEQDGLIRPRYSGTPVPIACDGLRKRWVTQAMGYASDGLGKNRACGPKAPNFKTMLLDNDKKASKSVNQAPIRYPSHDPSLACNPSLAMGPGYAMGTGLKPYFKDGAHLGHKPLKLAICRLWHPRVGTFLTGNRNRVAVINSHLTLEGAVKGLYLSAAVLRKKGHILVIDTRGEISPLSTLIETSNHCIPTSISFSGSRWMGGILTNWDSISVMVRRCAHISKEFDGFLAANRIYIPRYERMRQAYPGFVKVVSSFTANAGSLLAANSRQSVGTEANLLTKKAFIIENKGGAQGDPSTQPLMPVPHQARPLTVTPVPRNPGTPVPRYPSLAMGYASDGLRKRWVTQAMGTGVPGLRAGFETCGPKGTSVKSNVQSSRSPFLEIQLRFKRRPDLLWVLNPNENRHVIKEAERLSIPTIGLVDSNTNLSNITVPIPINTNTLFWSKKLIATLLTLSKF